MQSVLAKWEWRYVCLPHKALSTTKFGMKYQQKQNLYYVYCFSVRKPLFISSVNTVTSRWTPGLMARENISNMLNITFSY